MDWTKAKNILIIALLATNGLIATMFGLKVAERRSAWESEALHTAAYFQEQGVGIPADVPHVPVKMPVLFVRYADALEGAEPDSAVSGSTRIEVTNPAVRVVPIRRGTNRREIESASYALLKYMAAASAQGERVPDVADIELIYLVDHPEHDQPITEDTAVSAWKLTLAEGTVFYVNAYGE